MEYLHNLVKIVLEPLYLNKYVNNLVRHISITSLFYHINIQYLNILVLQISSTSKSSTYNKI